MSSPLKQRSKAQRIDGDVDSPLTPLTVEGTIISVRKHNGLDPPDLAGCNVKLKVVKRGDRGTKDAVQALPCIPDHVTPPSYQASREIQEAFEAPSVPIVSLTKDEDGDLQQGQQEDTDLAECMNDIEKGFHKPPSIVHTDSMSVDEDVERLDLRTPTNPDWANAMIRVLENLNEHQKFKKTALRARRRYRSHWWLAFRLAFWMLVIGGPVILYPVAEFFNSWGTRSSKYMASYNMAMQNFCFLLGPSLGASVRYSVEGVIGTGLALGNVLLINRAFGTYLNGGAYAKREEVVDVAMGNTIYASDWLPLCNLGNGERFVETNSTAEFLRECLFNVHWTAVTEGSVRSLIILVDLALFTGIFLYIGFGTCVRVYALIYVLYWAMAFVNPNSPAFSNDPSDPWTQSIMTCVGAFIAIVSQILPCPNEALVKATELTAELAETVAAVIEGLPFATKDEVSLAIESSIDGTRLWLSDIEGHLSHAWFEDFGILVSRSRRRRKLEAYTELLAALLQHASMANRLSRKLSPSSGTRLEDVLPSIQDICCAAAKAIPNPRNPVDKAAIEDFEEAMQALETEFPKAAAKNEMTGESLSFALALCTIASGTISRLKVLETMSFRTSWNPLRFLSELCVRIELPQTRNYPSHRRFVLRSTLAMVLAFLFGWVGLERMLNAYTSGAAATVATVVSTTTGAGFSLGLITRRLNAVVVGTVLGHSLGQVLAVQSEFHASLFALWLWLFAFVLTFQILHSKANAGVALPVLAIGVYALVPPSGVFREYNSSIDVGAELSLATSVKAAVLGGAIMLLLDLVLFSSARSLSQYQLQHTLKKSMGLLSRVMGLNSGKKDKAEPSNVDGSSNEEALVLRHLDDLKRLLPSAAEEPAPKGIEFPFELFSTLESSFRTIVSELGTLEWIFAMIAESSETASSLLSDRKDFESLLLEMENFFTSELTSIQVMLKDLYSRKLQSASSNTSGDAADLRQEILERGSDALRSAASPHGNVAHHASTRRLSGLLAAVGSRKQIFLNLVDKMRSAASTSRGSTPLSDMLSQVELLLSALHTCSSAVSTIQTVLAQYG